MKVRDLVAVATVVCLGVSGYGPQAVAAQTVVADSVALGASAQANMAAAQREAQHLLSLGRAPAGATALNSASGARALTGTWVRPR